MWCFNHLDSRTRLLQAFPLQVQLTPKSYRRSETRMVQKKSYRTDQEWLELIQECRSSGLSDKDWCDLNSISRSSFYYHLRKLRKQACHIPEALSSGKIPLRQEVVPVQIQDDNAISLLPTDPAPQLSGPGNSPAICIRFRNVEIEILNNADSDVIRNTLTAVGSLC